MGTKHEVHLTDDECDILHAIFSGAIGGPDAGRLGEPRRIVMGLAAKIPKLNPRRYRASVETLSRWGGMAVVIRDTKAAAEAAEG